MKENGLRQDSKRPLASDSGVYFFGGEEETVGEMRMYQ